MNLRYAAGVLAQPAADGASDVLRAQDGDADQARAVTKETGSTWLFNHFGPLGLALPGADHAQPRHLASEKSPPAPP